MQILQGLRVLDFGRFIAGPYCAALLADYGADVVRVERVGGAEDRCVPHVTETGEGGMYLQVNRNKRCLTLDVTSDEGREVVRRLLRTADVVVANLPPATLKSWGLDYDTVSALNPRTVLVVVSGYGATGPYASRVGLDGIGQAMSGAMHMTGLPGQPTRAAVTYVDFHTAQACAMGALAALLARERSGRGQLVEGSLLRSALVHTNGLLIEQAVRAPNRQPLGNRGYIAAPSDVFRTRDGHLLVQTVGQPMFERWCRLVGREDMLADARYADDEQRGIHAAQISAVMAEWCAQRSNEEALAALDRLKIPAGPVLTPQQALDDPHIRASGMLQPCDFGQTKGIPLVRHPVDLSDTPAELSRPAPRLGEHTDEILRELGYEAAAVAAMRIRGVV